MANEQDRLHAEFMRFLHTLAADRGCFVSDLSSTIAAEAMNLALEAYRMGIEDGKRQVSFNAPTVRAPYVDKLDAASQRPTRPPPRPIKRSARPPISR